MSENVPQKPKQTRPKKSEQMSVQAEPGDNTRYLLHNMAVSELSEEKLEIATATPEDVRNRVKAYFGLCAQNDMKPSIAGLALAFGVTRATLWNWVNGMIQSVPEANRKALEQAYIALNAQMEDYMQNGKINPVAGIFLMKNNLGYEDKKEFTVAPGNPLGQDTPSEELRRKYLEAVDTDGAERAENE